MARTPLFGGSATPRQHSLLRSEELDDPAALGLAHQLSGDYDHAFTPTEGLSRWRYRSSGIAQRTSAAFLAGVKRAKNTPAASAVYPLVYPLGTRRRQNPLKTGSLSPGSNGAGPHTIKKPQLKRPRAFFVHSDSTLPQRLQQRRQIFPRKALVQRQQLLIRRLALPSRTQPHNLLQSLLQLRQRHRRALAELGG